MGCCQVAGKHTDYAGGRSLLAAVPRGFCVVAVASTDPRACRVTTLHQGVSEGDRTTEVDWREGASAADAATAEAAKPAGHWSSYVTVALLRLKRNFPALRGVDLCVGCDLPVASGLSTSSALICAVFFAVDYVNNLQGGPARFVTLFIALMLCLL